MPLSYKQGQNLFVAGPNINIYPSGNSIAISGSASLGTLVTGLTSAGTGNILILSSITNNTTRLVQKSIIQGNGISISELQGGTLLFSATTLGTITSGQNIGTGFAVFTGVSNNNLIFRSLVAGPNLTIYTSSTSPGDLILSATSGSINGITAVTNIGAGTFITSSATSNILYARTFSGANGIEVVQSGDLIFIRPTTSLTSNRVLITTTNGAYATNDSFQVDPTVGSMAIGFNTPQVITTTRLLLEGSTSNISQIRLVPSSIYAGVSLLNGDIFYSTTGNTLWFNKGSTTLATPFLFRNQNLFLTGRTNNRVLQADSAGTLTALNTYFTPLGVFNSVTSTTISGLSELSVLNTGVTSLFGTNILFSSSHPSTPQLVLGKKYRFNARGTVTTSSSAGSLIARMKLGSTLIASSTTSLSNNIPVNSYFEINATFTIRSAGGTGNVMGSGYMLTDHTTLGTSNIVPINIIATSGVTLSTGSDLPFDLTLQNSTQPNNIYVINEATLEFLN